MSAAYNALGAPTRLSFGNGLDKINRYFGLEALAGQTASYGRLRNTCVINAGQACIESTATALFNTVYDYDNAGNVTVMTDVVKADRLNAAYDALNRLTSVTQDGALSTTLPVLNEAYSNDKIGNMTSKAGVTITAPATARYGFEAYSVYSTAGQCYCFAYAPNTGAWVFSGAAGVSENGTCLTSGNPPTPQMTRTAFLQTGGRMAITVTGLTVSETYRIGFVMARRGNYNAHLGRTFTVTMGGQNLGVYSPMTTTWEQALTAAVVANATSLQLVLEAGAEPGIDSMALIDDVAVMPAHPHAARAMGNGNSYEYDANGNMTIRRELSGTETFVYTQSWSIDNRLIGVTKATVTGTVLAVTTYAYDGDGARVTKEDPDGIVLYVGATEAVIGAAGTATAEYFDDVSGTTPSSFFATRAEVVEAGLTRSFTDTSPLAAMGDAPWAVRWQLWLTVPVAGTYTFAVFADDGFSFNGNGLSLSNGTTRAATTTETTSGAVMTPGNVYNFSLAYFNYTTATTSTIQLLWRRAGGALEIVPREAIHARGRRDYYSFAGAVVAMKEGVMSSATRTLTYLHGDHLGSTSLTTNAAGQKVSEQRYKPYGEVRWNSGAGMPIDFTFTGQRAGPANYVGSLMDYNARSFSPALGRFISADAIVPGAGNPQTLNRYAYVLNSPLNFLDPSGHMIEGSDGGPSLSTLFQWVDEGRYESCYVQSCHLTAYANWEQANPGSNWGSDPAVNGSQRSDLWLAQMANLAARHETPDFSEVLEWTAAAGMLAAEGGDLNPGAIGDSTPDMGSSAAGKMGPRPVEWVDETALLGTYAARGAGGASSLATAARHRAQLAGEEIAGGHAFEKHVLDRGEFRGLGSRTRQQFANHIENVINNPTSYRQLTGGRTAYWQESTSTLVIRDPFAVDCGTAFQPTAGSQYFLFNLR